VAFAWEKGDVLILDNRKAMHSRETFEGPRRVLASLWGPPLDLMLGESATASSDSSTASRPKSLGGAQHPRWAVRMPAAMRSAVQRLRGGGGGGGGPTSLSLCSGRLQMPAVGLGLWKVPKAVCAETVVSAIKAGYRHLDCACDYANEEEVGAGIRAAIDQGLVTREELWITSKLWNTYHAAEHVELACRRTLSDLGLDYVDLYLIHFPISLKYVDFGTRYPPEWVHDPGAAEPKMEMVHVPVSETWGAMEGLQRAGLAKAIGVCNFNTAGLRDLLSYASIPPAMLQVELHPFLQQPKLVRFCQEAGIAVTGFSPLGAGSYVELGMASDADSALSHPLIKELAAKHGVSPAQIILRWNVQRGVAVIPKSSKPERLAQNLALFGLELTPAEMDAISGLDQHRRFNDPGVFCEGMGAFAPIFD
jgi:D-xylose reductase